MRMSHRVNVLAAYRELLSLIHRLSREKIQPALQEARAAVQVCSSEAQARQSYTCSRNVFCLSTFPGLQTGTAVITQKL